MGMEFPVPDDAYTGPVTPFGGPSLEWAFKTGSSTSEPDEDDARLSVRGLPTIIPGVISHIRRVADLYPRSAANVHRIVLCVGVPLVEEMVLRNPGIANKLDQALMDSAEDGLREFRIRRSGLYPLSLGPQELPAHSIYAKNKGYTSRIRNMSEDIGLPVSKVTILCLVVGFAQSLDPNWVPLKWRDEFIQEVRFFEKWLQRAG